MATNYPTSLDSFTSPGPTDTQASVSHSGQHGNHNDAITALETKVGITSSAVTTTLDYKLTNASSADPGHTHTTSSLPNTLVTTSGSQTLTNKTLTTPIISSISNTGTLTLPTATTTLVGRGTTDTLTNKTLTAPAITSPVITTAFTASGLYDNGNSGSSITINWANGDRQKLTISASTTLTFSGAVAGQVLTLLLVENGTGNFTITLPTVKWPGGNAVSFTTTSGAINTLTALYDGTNYLVQASAGYA